MTLPNSILVYTRDELKRRDLVRELSERLENVDSITVTGPHDLETKLREARPLGAIIDIHHSDPIAPQILRLVRSKPTLKALPIVFLHDESRATRGLRAEASRNWLSRNLGPKPVVDRLMATMPAQIEPSDPKVDIHSVDDAQRAFQQVLEEIETSLASLEQSDVASAVRRLEQCSSQLRPFGLEEASSSALLPLRQHPNPTHVELAQAVREFRHITDSLTRLGAETRAAIIGARPEQLAALSEAWGERVTLSPCDSTDGLLKRARMTTPEIVILFDEDPRQTSKALQALRYLGAFTKPVVAVVGRSASPPLPGAENYGADLIFDANTAVDEIATRVIAAHHARATERPRAVLLEKTPGEFAPLIDLLKSIGVNTLVTQKADVLENLVRLDTCEIIVLRDTYPEVSGADLCRSLKSQDPVMVASLLVLYDPESAVPRSHFFDVGADDAMAWPPEDQEVKTRVRNLVKRTNALRALAERDDVTGLEHACSLPKRLLARTTPTHDGLSVLSVCVDDFDALRTRYGASAARTLLRTVADQLSDRLGDHRVFRGWGATFYSLSPKPLDKHEIEELSTALEDMRSITFKTRDGRGFYVTLHAAHLRVEADVTDVTTILNSLSRLASRAAASTCILSAQLSASDTSDAPLRPQNVSKQGERWTPVVLTQSDD